MNAPPLAIACALGFWGWQTGHLVVGLLLGLALEGLRASSLRLDLGEKEHATIADLSTVGFVLLAVLLAANRGIGRGILEAFTWHPIAISPILAAQLVSPDRRLPLSALFRYVRKMKQARPETRDPRLDLTAVYAALALLAAGVANQRGPEYYIGIVAGATFLLAASRPRRADLAAGALLIAGAAAIGHAGHVGLAYTQGALFDWFLDFDMRSIDVDPYRRRTEMGSLGRLKKYDAIVLRAHAPESDGDRVRLLHRGSYNSYRAGTWAAHGAPMENLDSEADNETWNLEAGAPTARTRLSVRMEAGRALMPLPPGTIRIGGFPATQIRRNALGAVQSQLAVDWASYEAQAVPGIAAYGPPTAEDTALPAEERAVLDAVVSELRLRALPPRERLRAIDRHLAEFTYSTFRDQPPPKDRTALADFLLRTRSGHCEYFATAATLLARAAGIPARYATGFSAVEYSRLEGAYVVRTRHAHAWSRTWVEGRWMDFDTTPASWAIEEAADAPLWQGLADLLRFAGFRWSQRGDFKAGDGWYAALALLAAVLAWRVLRGRRRLREDEARAALRPRHPGEDSEFYTVEKTLPPRGASETQAAWLARISPGLAEPQQAALAEALRLHQRYRFDPEGLDAGDRQRLRDLCAGVAAPR